MADENPFARLFGKKPSGTIASLARLAPGELTDEISITLAVLDPASSPPYDCISYDRSREWESIDIVVDGMPMPIPLPLKQTLQTVRHAKDSVLLWADLLTGSSVEERSKQAQVSKEVIQHARTVTCFLGNGSERSLEAYSVLQTMANWFKQGSLQCGFPAKLSMATQRHMTDLRAFLCSRNLSEIRAQDTALWQEIDAAICSSYFKSTQAITDIILGNDVLVRSGSGSMRWEDFNMALRAMLFILPTCGTTISPAVTESFQIIASIEISVQRATEGQSLELMPMIHSARDGTTSTDPRELVFAMLPVVTPSQRVKILGNQPELLPRVDYTKTTEQVFTEAAKYIIQERQDFLIWWNQIPPCARKIRSLPSFVPDWATPLPESAFYHHPENGLRRWCDSIKSPKRIYVDDNSLLHIQAHALDSIKCVSPVLTRETYRRIVLQMWQQGARVPGESQAQTIDKFWRALVMDTDASPGERLRDHVKPGQDVMASWQSLICEELILHTLGCTMDELQNSPALQARAKADPACADMGPATGKSARIEELILRNSLGRRMFWTASGRVGMTAVEGTSNTDDSANPPAPNFDAPLCDDMGRMMMESFQSFLAERDPAAAKVAAQVLQGDLPRQRAPGVRSGDVVAILVGGFQPYVLRPVQIDGATGDLKPDGKYAFVGDCHLQGAMDGECLVDRGYLYNGWKRVPLVDVCIV
jgi:hypothetical protein